MQELRDYLTTHRLWLAGLLSTSTSAASQDGQPQQSALLCSIIAALLKCCDPEVCHPATRPRQQVTAMTCKHGVQDASGKVPESVPKIARSYTGVMNLQANTAD